jgi:hypothetical protein
MQSTIRQYQKWKRFTVETLKFIEVATQYHNELEFEFQSAHDVQTYSLNKLRYGTKDKIKKVATITVGYAQKQKKK